MVGRRVATEDIYDALIDDESFAGLPARLARSFGARSAIVHWNYTDGAAEVLSHCGYFTDAQMADYAINFAPIDPWIAAASGVQPINQAANLEDYISSDRFERSTFYHEYIAAMGDDTTRCMGVQTVNDWGSGLVAFHRGRRQAAFEPETVAQMDADVVHLRRMLSVRGKLAGLERKLASRDAMLDRLPQATLLVTAQGRLLHANVAGEELLRRTVPLGLRHGRLSCSNPGAGEALRALIGQAADPAGPQAGAMLLACGNGSRLVLTAAPIRLPNGARQVLLIVQGPMADGGLGQRLQSLFGLTPTEAVVIERLADGASVGQIADERGVAEGTVRVQVKALLAKTGCSRQAELVALVKSVTPLRAG